MRIAICPGHHVDAPGAVNHNYELNEHAEACKVVTHAADMLMAAGHDVGVFKGRLGHKVSAVNGGEYQLAVDYHFNADADHADPHDLDDSRGTGCMVMYYPGNAMRKAQADAISRIMAPMLGRRDLGGRPGVYWGGANPGTKPDYFLAHTRCPAFITEAGYIDNNGFAKEWLVSGRHEDLAKALVAGLQPLIEQYGGASND